jgi:hypothetical protein
MTPITNSTGQAGTKKAAKKKARKTPSRIIGE